MRKIIYKIIKNDNKIKIKYKENLGITSVSIFFILFFLDFMLFTETFHFSLASFISIYIFHFNPFGSEFFIVFAMIPIIVSLSIFLLPFISMYIPIKFSQSIVKIYNAKGKSLFWKADIVFSLFYTIVLYLLTCWSYNILLYIHEFGTFFFIIAIYIFLFIILIITISLSYFIAKEICKVKELSSIDIAASFVFIIVFYILLVFLMKNISSSIDPYYALIIFFGFMISFIFIEFLIQQKLHQLKIVNWKVLYSGLIISSIVFMVLSYLANKKSWIELNENNSTSFNLILNKSFLSPNHMQIIVTGLINTHESNCILGCNISLNSNTNILPLSQGINLFFKKQDNNITCIYAVETKYYQGKPIYNLLDVGFIETNHSK